MSPTLAGIPLTPEQGPLDRRGRREAQARLQTAEILQHNHELLDALTGLHTQLRELHHVLVDNPGAVLFSGTALIDSTGVWCHDTRLPARAIWVHNLGVATMTVAAIGRGGAVPSAQGAAVWQVPVGVAVTINSVSASWSVYGSAGDTANVQIFTRHVAPHLGGGGSGNVNGGTP